MVEFYKIWIEQCEAAEGIQENFGTMKALGYLIGEKLVNFVRNSWKDPEFAAELLHFIAEIKRIFEPHEIREYFENFRRVGPLGHVCTDEEFEFLRTAGAVEESPVEGAEEVLIVERIKEMLLK
ncbi:MAG: hypothetical protein HYR79_09280 [Nitrospirae bacterium]|nr:hypothetical protein [Nitrospirota bacterium]